MLRRRYQVSFPGGSASIADRRKFWANLNDRLAKLGNRPGPDADKIVAAIHERVPIPTIEDQSELQLENVRAKEARDRVARLECGEDLPGALGQPVATDIVWKPA